MIENNNTGVPAYVHITTTIIVIFVFSVALEEACSLSIKHELFRIRIGVLLSNAILCVLSIVLNFDLLRNNDQIQFLDSNFVLIVRTLQILWLFIAFFIGYFFVIYSINSAYKSSSFISIDNDHQHEILKKAPNWMSKFWLICTIFMEITLFLCYIIAFTTTDIMYIHICWISAFGFCIIGALLVIFALIDIRKYVWNKTKTKIKTNNNVFNLKKLNRLLITMIILCILIITASIINLINLITHILTIDDILRPNTLSSTAIDNIPDYISYFLILLSVEISFVFWTYKPLSVNYCLFCCCYCCYNGYKQKAAIKKEFRLDRNTMCYAFCKNCIDNAERKRQQIILMEEQQQTQQQQQEEQKEEEPEQEEEETIDIQTKHTPKRPSYFSITTNIKQQNIINHNSESIQSVQSRKNIKNIKIILYDFDGVLTNKKHRYFEHWTEIDVKALTKTHLNSTFGEDERINYLCQHLNFLITNNIKIYCVSYEITAKIWTIFEKLQFNQYFDKNTIIGCDHKLIKNQQSKHSQIKLFILNLIKQQQIDNDQLLYISANNENTIHFANINLCTTYNISSDHGINQNDIHNIQSLI